MPITTLHTGHGITFEAAGGVLTQIPSLTYSTNTEVLDGFGNGCPERLFVGMMKQMPEFQFTTSQLETLLQYLNFTGLYTYCPSSAVTVEFRELSNCGIRFGRAVETHITANMTRPFMVLDSIEASQDAEATAEVRILPIFDGFVAPVFFTDFKAILTECGSAEHFVPGPVFLGGVGEIPGVQRLRIDFNTQLHEHSAKGDAWPCWVGVKDHSPRVTIDVLDMSQVVATALSGAMIGGSGGTIPYAARFYLRKLENMSETGFDGRFDDAAPQHLQWDTSFSLIHIGEASYTGPNDEVVTQVVFETAAAAEGTATLGNLTNQPITQP